MRCPTGPIFLGPGDGWGALFWPQPLTSLACPVCVRLPPLPVLVFVPPSPLCVCSSPLTYVCVRPPPHLCVCLSAPLLVFAFDPPLLCLRLSPPLKCDMLMNELNLQFVFFPQYKFTITIKFSNFVKYPVDFLILHIYKKNTQYRKMI